MATVSFSFTIGTTPSSQQLEQRVARVQEVLALLQAVARHQHLSDLLAVPGEAPLVDLDQSDLSDGGGGLLLGDRAPGVRPAEPAAADRDRARGHHHHLAAGVLQRGDLARDLAEHAVAQLAVAGEDGAPHLDHDAPGARGGGAGACGGRH